MTSGAGQQKKREGGALPYESADLKVGATKHPSPGRWRVHPLPWEKVSFLFIYVREAWAFSLVSPFLRLARFYSSGSWSHMPGAPKDSLPENEPCTTCRTASSATCLPPGVCARSQKYS